MEMLKVQAKRKWCRVDVSHWKRQEAAYRPVHTDQEPRWVQSADDPPKSTNWILRLATTTSRTVGTKKNKGNKIKQYKNITLQMSPLQYMAFTPPPLSSNSPSHKPWNLRSFVHGSFWTLMTDIKMSVNSTHLKMQIFVFLQQHRDVSSMASIGKSQPLQPKYK